MIFLLLVCLCCGLAQTTCRSPYEKWRAEYPDSKWSSSLLYQRLSRQAWEENFDHVQRHNANPRKSFKMALSKIADRTHKEYIDIYLKPRYGVMNLKPVVDSRLEYTGRVSSKLPELNTYQRLPRHRNYSLHKPEDQVSCGACYIFSALAVLEYHMAELLNVPDIRLSVQYVIDCGLQHNLQGCLGGSGKDVYAFINAHGIIESKYYEYSAREGTCNLTPFQKSKILRPKIKYFVKKNIKKEYVKTIVHNFGPVVVGFDAEPLEIFLYGYVFSSHA
ncbi:hypothetical protein Ciccas_013566 [Cichlidogyrus casuarinus]|uniref:Uncharacterized protein n=1 Tax=Cichlidogyrus casuarinus TaxID=1844966 RepID=A0ABD2PKS0_9PLAT